MRARELLDENYNQSLQIDVDNLLIGAKGSGAKQVDTTDLVTQLQGMGYSVDVNSLITLLGSNPAVTNVTPETIVLTSPEGSDDSTEDSADAVSNLAQQATNIG